MIKALLFDVDGVLTSSADISKHLVARYFAGKGIKIEPSSVIPHLGKGMEALFTLTAKDNSVNVDLAEALSFFKDHYKDELSLWGPVPGAKDFIIDAKKKGFKLALVSSAPRWRVEDNISYIGFTPKDFDVVISEEDVKRNKPYPDIWLKAMLELGVDGNECVVFEDSISGIESGKKAGACVIALSGTIGKEKARESGADGVIDSFQSFPSFSSLEDFRLALEKVEGRSKNAVKYGANWIEPLERKMPDSVVEKEAIEKAFEAMSHAYVPYSHFRVGASILSAATGRIYSGCNMENASYGATICAERNALTTAVANEGAIGIDLVVVVSESSHPAEPCGVCLQVMSEFILPTTPVVLVNSNGKSVRYKFSDLLPHSFSFEER